MATQTKLQRLLSKQLIVPRVWTLVTFDVIIRDDRDMQRRMSTITPPADGDFIWARNISWDSFEIPAGDTRPRQLLSRFVRDPFGKRDDTGTDDRLDTPGKDVSTIVWPFRGEAGVPVGVEVYHDHDVNGEDVPLTIYQAQFSATTWDY